MFAVHVFLMWSIILIVIFITVVVDDAADAVSGSGRVAGSEQDASHCQRGVQLPQRRSSGGPGQGHQRQPIHLGTTRGQPGTAVVGGRGRGGEGCVEEAGVGGGVAGE